ncbi:MAG: biopolymer transporter ExbD [Bacteroidia bacterium]|nr:biopolymer transporter ExbD [Bacteroidia bacterium]MCZ2277945.1 biopolymer transporter ExbD [Bacteroidia bacterium]
MARFKKKLGSRSPKISTASLPDIVFMLLFFFMVTTTIRDASLKVQVKPPTATEIQKLEKKSLVSYIYVGPPTQQYQAKFGTEPRIQLNDSYASLGEVAQFVEMERKQRDEKVVPQMTFSLKIDKDVKMGIVTDLKQELRKVNALKINYSTKKGSQKTE